MKRKTYSFFYHFNRQGHKRGDPDVWTVHYRGRCTHVRSVQCFVPTRTIFKGDTAAQPRAIVKGIGRVVISQPVARIYGSQATPEWYRRKAKYHQEPQVWQENKK